MEEGGIRREGQGWGETKLVGPMEMEANMGSNPGESRETHFVVAEPRSQIPGVVDHRLVKKYFLEMYNEALKKAVKEQEEMEKSGGQPRRDGEHLRRSTFSQMSKQFGEAIKESGAGAFGTDGHWGRLSFGGGGGDQYHGYDEDSSQDGDLGRIHGVAQYNDIAPFGSGHKHKHHHHEHSHSHTNDHKHVHKHLHEHEESHEHKAKHQHVHKHEHHHEHNHHHKHQEGHEHEEEHKHAHKHEHAHKGSSWRRNGEDLEIENDDLLMTLTSDPEVALSQVPEKVNRRVEWNQEYPRIADSDQEKTEFEEYEEIEYGWEK